MGLLDLTGDLLRLMPYNSLKIFLYLLISVFWLYIDLVLVYRYTDVAAAGNFWLL